MKKRIWIDGTFMWILIFSSGFVFMCREWHMTNLLWDNILDFLGYITVLKGTLLRMTARGHKKRMNPEGNQLVTSGPYQYIRNPMYLGSLSIGIGFILIAWPLWFLPVFICLFFLRFFQTIKSEEAFLLKEFGPAYQKFLDSVPRIYPKFNQWFHIKTNILFNFQDAFYTSEKRGLLNFTLLAILLESLQQYLVFGVLDIITMLIIFGSAGLVLFVSLKVLNKVQ